MFSLGVFTLTSAVLWHTFITDFELCFFFQLSRRDVLCEGGKKEYSEITKVRRCWFIPAQVHICPGICTVSWKLGPFSPHSCPLKLSKTTWNHYYFALDFLCSFRVVSFRVVLSKWAKGDRYIEISTEQWNLGCNHFFRWLHRRISFLVFCPQGLSLEEPRTIFQ